MEVSAALRVMGEVNRVVIGKKRMYRESHDSHTGGRPHSD